MKKLALSKPWQVFIAIVIIPLILVATQFSGISNYLEAHKQPQFLEAIQTINSLPIMIALTGILYFIWLYTCGYVLSKAEQNETPHKLFFITISYSIIFLLAADILIIYSINSKELNVFYIFLLLIALAIYVLSVLFNIHFVARKLSLSGSDDRLNYGFAAILLILYPIGVWFIQSIINLKAHKVHS